MLSLSGNGAGGSRNAVRNEGAESWIATERRLLTGALREKAPNKSLRLLNFSCHPQQEVIMAATIDIKILRDGAVRLS